MLDEGQFSAAVDSTAVTRDFSKLIEWMVTELRAVAKLEEYVHSIESMYMLQLLILVVTKNIFCKIRNEKKIQL